MNNPPSRFASSAIAAGASEFIFIAASRLRFCLVHRRISCGIDQHGRPNSANLRSQALDDSSDRFRAARADDFAQPLKSLLGFPRKLAVPANNHDFLNRSVHCAKTICRLRLTASVSNAHGCLEGRPFQQAAKILAVSIGAVRLRQRLKLSGIDETKLERYFFRAANLQSLPLLNGLDKRRSFQK